MECSLQNVFLRNVLNRMFFSGMFFIRVFSFIREEADRKMSPHGKKMIAPVVITIIFLLYLFIYGAMVKKMILTTTETICGKELETLGLVKGSTIQTVNAVRDIGAGLKTLVGGELTRYNEMMNDARALATKRMVGEAEAMGADAIVAVRYSSASVMQSAAEVMAYGTAVRFLN